MPDINGKPWVKFSTAKVGQVIVADSGFDCIAEGTKLTIQEDADGLFVPCEEGHHYLDGQHDYTTDDLVGFYPNPD